MLTKREYCETVVREEMNVLDIKERKDAHCFIYASSCLAVALEYLGELTPEEKCYSTTRGGIVKQYLDFNEDGTFKDVYFLSVRDMIKLLPETIDREKPKNGESK